jgi:hypothetical protein
MVKEYAQIQAPASIQTSLGAAIPGKVAPAVFGGLVNAGQSDYNLAVPKCRLT